MRPAQPGAGGPCSCGCRARRVMIGVLDPGRAEADLAERVAAVGARPASPVRGHGSTRLVMRPRQADLRGHARPAARDSATPPRGHHRGRRDRAAGPFTICRDLTRFPATDYRPLRINSSRMRVEPGQDLATFPAVMLADLIERRPGSQTGVANRVAFLIFSSAQTSSVVKISSRTEGLGRSSLCVRLTGRALLPCGADLASASPAEWQQQVSCCVPTVTALDHDWSPPQAVVRAGPTHPSASLRACAPTHHRGCRPAPVRSVPPSTAAPVAVHGERRSRRRANVASLIAWDVWRNATR
jgi:hypothetical protein